MLDDFLCEIQCEDFEELYLHHRILFEESFKFVKEGR